MSWRPFRRREALSWARWRLKRAKITFRHDFDEFANVLRGEGGLKAAEDGGTLAEGSGELAMGGIPASGRSRGVALLRGQILADQEDRDAFF